MVYPYENVHNFLLPYCFNLSDSNEKYVTDSFQHCNNTERE